MLEHQGSASVVALPVGTAVNADAVHARELFGQVLLRAHSIPKLLDAGNLLASGLLVIAAYMLLRRSHTAVWWTMQACIANGLHALVRSGAYAQRIHAHIGELARAIDAVVAAERAALPAAERTAEIPVGVDVVHMMSGMWVVVGALLAVMYGLIATRMRKQDVALALKPAGQADD